MEVNKINDLKSIEEDDPNKIRIALRELKHPEIDLDLVELGMIGKIKEKNNKVYVELKLPFKKIPIKQMLMEQIEEKLSDRIVEVKPCLMREDDKAAFMILARKHWKNEK
jgi:metal-sulfur cluster biosynthetic enzyme